MSFAFLRFARSQYLRDNLGAFVPSDAYWSYVIALVRTNPEFTNLTSYSGSRTLNTYNINDSDSPTTAILGGWTSQSWFLNPNSPYSTKYPGTDSVYSFSQNTYYLSTGINDYANIVNSNVAYPSSVSTALNQSYSYNINATYNQMYMSDSLDIGVAIKNGFTLECWVYVPTTGISTLSGFLLGAQHSVFLFVNSDRTVTMQYSPFYNTSTSFTAGYTDTDNNTIDPNYRTSNYSVNLCTLISSATLTAGSWNHVAVTCSYTPQMGTNTGSTNLFINGTRVGQQLNPTVSTGFTGIRTPLSSSNMYKNTIITGSKLEITGIRFIAGNCLSVDNFTPPTSKVSGNVIGWNGSTSTFTHTACFITHFSTNGKYVPLIDYSPYRHYVTASNGTYYIEQSSSYLPNISNATTNLKSIYFNGTTSPAVGLMQNPQQQLINTTNSVLGLLNDQSFTVNFFFYRTSTAKFYLFDHGVIQLYITGTTLNLRLGSTSIYIGLAAGSADTSKWIYVQLSRTNNGTSKTEKLTAIDQYGTVYAGADYTHTSRGANLVPAFASTASQLFIGSDAANTVASIAGGYIVDYRVTAGLVRPTPTTFPNFHPTVAPS